ncbi:hypothetical protein RHSIM_Rhsim02G0204600 [Rhododendron simsii]|uniref:Uncharacterized protein n=1 Tax=Rhododendron simsii TaxID=118357 RepID=A0A834LVW4_RHOSS|nr:hypothetical protein RHSIM_Rhsim02G0204600 [Rhododendron simsii]
MTGCWVAWCDPPANKPLEQEFPTRDEAVSSPSGVSFGLIFGTINPSSTPVSPAKIVPPPPLWTSVASPSSIPSTSNRSSIAKGLLNRSSFSLMDSYRCFSTAES